jgi:hypothetical protein
MILYQEYLWLATSFFCLKGFLKKLWTLFLCYFRGSSILLENFRVCFLRYYCLSHNDIFDAIVTLIITIKATNYLSLTEKYLMS